MQVDGADDAGQHGQEDGVVLRVLAGVEEVLAVVGHGPVVVLAAAVDAREGFFVQEADEAVAVGHVAQRLHDEHVVVDGEVELLEHRRELELRGGHLVVAGLGGDAQAPELALHILHEGEDARLDGAEVVVLQLLVAGGRRAEEGAAALDEVGPLEPEGLVDEEILLLRAERADHAPVRPLAEAGHQPPHRLLHRLHGAQEGRLLVEHLTGVGAEDGGDAEGGAVGVALDEGRARNVPGRVAARLEGTPQPAGGETRCIRLAHDQVLAGEARERPPHARRLEEGVVLLGGAAGERLEPVGEVRRAAVHRPLLEGVGHLVGDGGIERRVVAHRVQQRLRRVLRQILAHDALVEDVRAVFDFRVVHDCSVLGVVSPFCCNRRAKSVGRTPERRPARPSRLCGLYSFFRAASPILGRSLPNRNNRRIFRRVYPFL